MIDVQQWWRRYIHAPVCRFYLYLLLDSVACSPEHAFCWMYDSNGSAQLLKMLLNLNWVLKSAVIYSVRRSLSCVFRQVSTFKRFIFRFTLLKCWHSRVWTLSPEKHTHLATKEVLKSLFNLVHFFLSLSVVVLLKTLVFWTKVLFLLQSTWSPSHLCQNWGFCLLFPNTLEWPRHTLARVHGGAIFCNSE